MKENKYAYYNYGFQNARLHEQNPEIIDIEYGFHKKYYIHKKNAYKFAYATLPFLREFSVSTNVNLVEEAQQDPVKFLNIYMDGMPIVIATEFCDYSEYINGAQNRVVGVTSMNIEGKINDDLFIDNVTYHELYPPKTSSLENEDGGPVQE